jgi:hypothetical protein
MPMDMLTADQLMNAHVHVVALLELDEYTVTPDERELLLGLDQRLQRAIHMRAFGSSLAPSEHM